MSPGLLTWNLGDDLRQLFAYHFMVNALEAGGIVAVVAGVVGWFMVLRRQSFAGHTLAMVSFPGAAGAILLGASATAGYFVAAIVGALVIAAVPRPLQHSSFSSESAVIGTVQAFALALGALFVSLYGGFLNGLTGLLFGTFLGVSDAQVVILLVVAAAALAILATIGRPLLFATVDPEVARTRGVPVGGLSAGFLVLLGATAAEVSQITGVLLVFALLVMPASAAQRLTWVPWRSLVATVGIGLAATWLGLAAAYFSPYPVGFWITTFAFAAYVVASVASIAAKGAVRRPRPPAGSLP